MPPERLPPDSCGEWINRAHSDLAIAQTRIEGAYLEDLCFHAQQAAEKALKALFIYHGWSFPYIHDLAELVNQLLSNGINIPTDIRDCVILTEYAVAGRYPGLDEPVLDDEYKEALVKAERVLRWVEEQTRA